MGPLLLNYLVRAQQDRWGYLKTERLGGLAVQDHLELGRKLHREIARLLAQLPSTLCQRERRYFAESLHRRLPGEFFRQLFGGQVKRA